MSDEQDQDQADDEELHQTIVEYVASDPHDSGGCLGVILMAVAPLLVFLLLRL